MILNAIGLTFLALSNVYAQCVNSITPSCGVYDSGSAKLFLVPNHSLSILIHTVRSTARYCVILRNCLIEEEFGVTAPCGAFRKELFLNFLQMAKPIAAIASRSSSRHLNIHVACYTQSGCYELHDN